MSLYDFMFSESSTLEQPWFIDAETGYTLTGSDIKTRTDALAQGLNSQLGLGSSPTGSDLNYGIREVVGIVTPNSVDFATIVWACHKLGYTVASLNGASTVDELKHQFSLSGTGTVFTHEECLERVIAAAAACQIPASRIVVISRAEEFVLPETSQGVGYLTMAELTRLGKRESSSTPQVTLESYNSPIAFLCFSSGTTGLPKAVILPHSAIIANIIQLKKASVPTGRMASGDKALAVIPLSHIFGLVTLVHTCPHLGIASVVFKSMPTFDILLDAIVRLRIGHFFLVPSLVHAFVKHPATIKYDLGFFESAMIAAAPLDGEMESAFQKIGGPDFLATQVFGMTECGGMITGLPFGVCPRPGFVGTLLSSTEAKIVDENGRPLPPGQRGHLCVRGPQLCLGYLNNAQATQDAFDADGFLLTGDIADMSVDGFFRIVDRAKRMIKNKGYQVSPAELEAHLLGLELVADAGVIGRPDDRCGEVPVAFVVLSASGSHKASQNAEIVKEAIKISVQEVKSPFKWLHAVYFVQTIPRLPSGKIIVARLRQILESAVPGDVDQRV
ncbi:hypothetical protein B0H14DRAFT_2444459 [Mycena olivaceomarginata]|nr:hypothetical protein B0H14DRAFT_2444459 [Mycena olivaceomarginata]